MLISGIHHATFITRDLSKARQFYEGVLGLHADGKRPALGYEGVWYEIGPMQQIHLMCLPDSESASAGVHSTAFGRERHVAFVVADMAQLVERLSAAGIVHSWSKSGRAAVFCRDPDQNVLEFIAQ